MKLRPLICILFLLSASLLGAQEYEDYIGKDHNQGITITTSDDHQQFGWDEIASGENTLNGNGLTGEFVKAARFLNQATFGGTEELIHELAGQDFGQWIDNQANMPISSHLEMMTEINATTFQQHLDAGLDSSDYFGPSFRHVQYAWWQINMTSEDILRQRMAYALSEILVVSFNSILESHADGVASYYDVLSRNALGDFESLLYEVTLHPAMGGYLSHYNNPLNIDSLNIHPDENYAREIMQLFSIGLYELNIDGTPVLDGDGQRIPTYDNDDIKEFAKIFTGLSAGALAEYVDWVEEPYFGISAYAMDWTHPMAMYEFWHEPGEKNLLNGFSVPAGQTGLQDIQMTINHLFNHNNVAPFLSKRLIQHFVKSNPTPAYVQRVAEVFEDNGSGLRGDLLATIKAVLMDDEARTCEWSQDAYQGKLKEPLMRYIQFARAAENQSETGRYWNVGYRFFEATGQLPMYSPTVFNFFSPDYVPTPEMEEAGLVGPEYQIHNSRTSLEYLNETGSWSLYWSLMDDWDFEDPVFVDFNALSQMARDPDVLVDHLDIYFLNGQLTEATRNNIVNTISQMTASTMGINYLDSRARMATYLMTISPDYAVLK